MRRAVLQSFRATMAVGKRYVPVPLKNPRSFNCSQPSDVTSMCYVTKACMDRRRSHAATGVRAARLGQHPGTFDRECRKEGKGG